MTLEEAIVKHLADKTTYPMIMPANPTLPCVVYQRISGVTLPVAGYTEPRYQLACWARTYGASLTLGHQVKDAFYNQHLDVDGVHFHSQIETDMDGEPDLDSGLFCRLVDVRFILRELV